MKKISLGVIYFLQFLALFPILRYLYYFVITKHTFEYDKYVFERVFISAPVLIILGLVMIFKFGKVNRIFGIIFIIIALGWSIIIFKSFSAG